MLLFENIAIAIAGLLSNKMRAVLTMLGIIIGISSVIGIVTIGDSMTSGITEEMMSWGAGNINAYLQQKMEEDFSGEDDGYYIEWTEPEEQDMMDNDMLDKLMKECPDIDCIFTSDYVDAYEATANGQSAYIQTFACTPSYAEPNRVNVISGRFLSDADDDGRKQVCVVSEMLCETLFPGIDPIGKKIDLTIYEEPYEMYIVGVYEEKQSQSAFSFSGDYSTMVYIPLSTYRYITNGFDGYNNVTIVGKTDADLNALTADINSFFEREYASNSSFTAIAYNDQEWVESTTESYKMIALAIAVIAGISLLVGGIGVMNIMLVSITERTREIGIRKAMGATTGSIRLQFIVESVLICLIGGVFGISLGLVIGSVGSNLLGYEAVPSASVIVIAVAFSMLIGVFFGYYPANKAAKLDPIEALRYE